MKTRLLILALVLALSVSAAGAALANEMVELSRWVLGGGASDATSGSVTLRATLGQPIVGLGASSSGEVTLGQGAWHGGSLPEGGYDAYLPIVFKTVEP